MAGGDGALDLEELVGLISPARLNHQAEGGWRGWCVKPGQLESG